MQYNNTYIRSLFSPGFSSIMLSFYKTNLTLGFTPCSGKDQRGFDQYDKQKFLSTTIDYEKAAALYLVSRTILEGKETQQVQLVLPCNNQTTLLFEYKPDQNAQMRACLTIDKKGERIPFAFTVRQYQEKVDGRIVTKVIQTGLGVFVMTLEAYLQAIGADRHLSRLSEEELGAPQVPMWIGQ